MLTALADRMTGPVLGLIGALNVLFAISFMATALLAAQALPAASAEACRGKNVIEELRHTDPARYSALREEASQIIYGDAVLFRVENARGEPSWLFGTMHLTDERVIELPPRAQEAFDQAATVAIETVEILDPAKTQAALFSRPELTMFTDGQKISDFLTEDEKEILKQGLAARGIQLALVDRMKPWLLTGMVALPACELGRKKAGEVFLDLKLAQKAESDDKRLVGLETLAEQFDAISSLPIKFHVRGLVDTIALGERVDDVIETMIQLYEDGQTGMIWPMLRLVSPEIGEDDELAAGYAAFEEALVNVRNETMLERSRELVDRGGAFIAVGALHLPGEKGLASLFERAGYRVTAIR